MSDASPSQDRRIPMTVVGGFLGAGKTTLINHLLSEGTGGGGTGGGGLGGENFVKGKPTARRPAVIVNDFGRVAVDASLIARQTDNMLVLRNGCICCTLAGNLIQGIVKLLDADPEIDWLLMETSGVAMSWSLANILNDPILEPRVRVDRWVVVADAVRHARVRRVAVAVDEVAKNADVLLLNRCDLADDTQRSEALVALREVNPDAPIFEIEHGRVDPAAIWGAERPAPESPTLEAKSPEAGRPGAESRRPRGDGDDWHTARVIFSDPVDADRLRSSLGELPDEVWRLKGFVVCTNGDLLHVECAGESVNIAPFDPEGPPEEERRTLVAIGTNPLKALLGGCFSQLGAVEIVEDDAPHRHDHSHH